MLHRYKALLRHSEGRLQMGLGHLVQRQQALAQEQERYRRLSQDMVLQSQLAEAGRIDGMAVSRQQLFSWLRKEAADCRRTQDLRLTLGRQENVIEDCNKRIEEQRMVCLALEKRQKRYQILLKKEKKKIDLRQINTTENEIEENRSWFK